MWERLLRWPILLLITFALTIDFTLYLILRCFIVTYEFFFIRTWQRGRKTLLSKLEHAKSFEEWRRAAEDCDLAEGNDRWKNENASPHYNADLILSLTGQLKSAIQKEDHERLLDVLGSAVLRSDVGGIDNALLYSQTYYRTKDSIEKFLDCCEEAIRQVKDSEVLLREQKHTLGQMADRAFGRTALCLSGGATLGFYHLGVIKELVETDMLPLVISGTSAGAALAAWICTHDMPTVKSDLQDPQRLADLFTFTSDSWAVRLYRLFKKGHMLDVEESMKRCKIICSGTMTFMESFQKTGRVLNITVNAATPHAPPRILNYQTAPNVMIYSAIMASASVPGLLPPVQLRSKGPTGASCLSSPSDLFGSQVGLNEDDYVVFDELGSHWRDGSISIDIPTDMLRPLFNVHYTIVSQVNPGVVYFFYHARGAVGEPHGHRQGKGWRAGFVMSLLEMLLKLDMKRYLELLAGMDLLPKFLRLDWSLLALQRRDGTVTILPRASGPFSLMSKILAIPTAESMQECIKVGQQATWPCLHMIHNRMRIEKGIQSLLQL